MSYIDSLNRLTAEVGNLGVPIDLEKKDGSGIMLVPQSSSVLFENKTQKYVVGLIPVFVIIILLLIMPNFIKDQIDLRTTKLSVKKLLLWTIVITVVLWTVLYIYVTNRNKLKL